MKTKTTVFYLILILIVASCETEKPFVCSCDTSQMVYNDSIIDSFFQNTTFFQRKKATFEIDPIIMQKQESYRLEMGHSFSRYTQIYTISETNEGASLEVRQYYYDREKHETTLDKKYDLTLTLNQWNSIKTMIDSTCYWSNKIGKDRCMSCSDGGHWMFEGYNPDKRNCANRVYNIDVCDFGSRGELGKLCRVIRDFANEEKLDIYNH